MRDILVAQCGAQVERNRGRGPRPLLVLQIKTLLISFTHGTSPLQILQLLICKKCLLSLVRAWLIEEARAGSQLALSRTCLNAAHNFVTRLRVECMALVTAILSRRLPSSLLRTLSKEGL